MMKEKKIIFFHQCQNKHTPIFDKSFFLIIFPFPFFNSTFVWNTILIMSGKKKAQKMSLSDFLADDTIGGNTSWADDIPELPSAPTAKLADRSDSFNSRGYERVERGYERSDRNFDRGDRGFDRSQGDRYERQGDRGSDRGSDRGGYDRERSFAPRTPVELPTEPPFTAHVANLSFNFTEEDLADLFGNMKIANIRLLRDRATERSKGFGYVEFQDLDSLKGALELSGENVQGRNIRVSVAEPPRDSERVRQPDRTDVDSWRRTGPIESSEPPRRGYGNSERGVFGGRGGYGGRESTWGRGRQEDHPVERPRLNLMPRSVETQNKPAPKTGGSKPDPFGGAKPVDTEKVLHHVEQKLESKEHPTKSEKA
ncbi:hypothetical protein BDB01DRAFT_812632 [Pilobolus umbonatus]|nr:hypothetical protein BDB01DRAFT_812632 [Pilobolus umbonatus]